jgi:hypothetical protein
VEKWNSFTRTRKDLWGWADLLAIRRGEVLAVQVTAQAVANRVAKVSGNLKQSAGCARLAFGSKFTVGVKMQKTGMCSGLLICRNKWTKIILR